MIEGQLEAESRQSFPIHVEVAPGAAAGTKIVALDVTLDGHRYGQRFDFIVGVDAEKLPNAH